jgi:hypothetical protein
MPPFPTRTPPAGPGWKRREMLQWGSIGGWSLLAEGAGVDEYAAGIGEHVPYRQELTP